MRAQQRLDERLLAVRRAAEEWGLRNDTPEGLTLSGLMGSVSEMGEVTVEAISALVEVSERMEEVAQGQHREATDSIARLYQAAGESGRLTEQLRKAVVRAEGMETQLPGLVAAQIGPAIGDHLRTSLHRQLTLRNRAESLKHWAGVVAISFVIFVGGWITGLSTRQPSDVERAVAGCEVNPIVSGGQSYCALRSLQTFVPPG